MKKKTQSKPKAAPAKVAESKIKFRPAGDRVLVKPETAVDEKSPSGIIIPETARKEKPETGRIVAVGALVVIAPTLLDLRSGAHRRRRAGQGRHASLPRRSAPPPAR